MANIEVCCVCVCVIIQVCLSGRCFISSIL